MGDPSDERIPELFDGIETADDLDGADAWPPVPSPDRPRGILTPTDREYLYGRKEYAQPQTDANRRQDIRERVCNAMKDFTTLSLFLPAEEREKVFDELGTDWTDEALASMVAFAYLGLEQDRPRFERSIERGVLQAENLDKLFQSAGRATEADVSISVEYNPDIAKLYQQFQNGKNLTDAEIGVLVREGKLDSDDLDQLESSTGTFQIVSSGAEFEQ